jgi:serine/threonine protein kinase
MLFGDRIVTSKNVKVVNEIPKYDFDKIMNTVFTSGYKYNGGNDRPESLGSGAFGTVYLIEGEDDAEYAVKVIYDITKDKPHDANFLEHLQGDECYLKLFFYVDGEYKCNITSQNSYRYLVMVTPRVKGHTFSAILEGRKSSELKVEFFKNMQNNLVDKLQEAFDKAVKVGIKPVDLHQGNLMFNLDTGMAVIVDTGNFQYFSNEKGEGKNKANELHQVRSCMHDIEHAIRSSEEEFQRQQNKLKKEAV